MSWKIQHCSLICIIINPHFVARHKLSFFYIYNNLAIVYFPANKFIAFSGVVSQYRNLAKTECRYIKESEIFEPCFSAVDAEVFMRMCIYDVCSREDAQDFTPMCTVMAAMARECALQGITVDWRGHDDLRVQCREYTHNCRWHVVITTAN